MGHPVGLYSAKKNYFFPGGQINCEKISPYFQNCIFWGKKFANYGVEMEKIALFRVKSIFYFFTTPLLIFGRILTYGND